MLKCNLCTRIERDSASDENDVSSLKGERVILSTRKDNHGCQQGTLPIPNCHSSQYLNELRLRLWPEDRFVGKMACKPDKLKTMSTQALLSKKLSKAISEKLSKKPT